MSHNNTEIIDRLNQELINLLDDRLTFQKSKAVAPLVVDALIEFSKNDIFARALISSKQSLTECCNAIMKGAKAHISDNEVFTKAAKFYMPEANVSIVMEIKMDKPINQSDNTTRSDLYADVKKKREKIDISLDDLL